MGARASLIGTTIGNYKVVSKLGEGGMGTVYLAEHPLIGKKVALKVLHPELARHPDVVTRFFNEARAVNGIGHPNIVDVVDYGVLPRDDANLVYFIMELLLGESLGALLKREAPLAVERALRVAVQVGEALGACHAKGVIHRDLKPDNIYLATRGRETEVVKVLDFGIAKLTSSRPEAMSRTRTGVVMGTPAYMSPEQCEGKRGIDARTDVYALGVILYEMVTGKVPFTGEGYGEIILQHMTQPPARPSSIRSVIPPAIEAIVLRALEKRRDDRFGTMELFVEAMRDPDRYQRSPGQFTGPRHRRATTAPGRKLSRAPEAFQETVDTAARPTTLTHSAAELGVHKARSRVPVIAASAFVVLGLGGGAAVLLARGGTTAHEELPIVVQHPSSAPTPAPVPVPAPVPPPAAPVPPAPQTIRVSVSSVPAGAQVIIADEPRGATPLIVELPRSEGEVQLSLELAGYKPKVKTLNASRDAELEVTLEREHRHRDRVAEPVAEPAAPPPPPAPPPPKKPSDDDILPPEFHQ